MQGPCPSRPCVLPNFNFHSSTDLLSPFYRRFQDLERPTTMPRTHPGEWHIWESHPICYLAPKLSPFLKEPGKPQDILNITLKREIWSSMIYNKIIEFINSPEGNLMVYWCYIPNHSYQIPNRQTVHAAFTLFSLQSLILAILQDVCPGPPHLSYLCPFSSLFSNLIKLVTKFSCCFTFLMLFTFVPLISVAEVQVRDKALRLLY